MKILSASENQEQKAFVKWLSFHPIVRDYFCKIHNEGKRTAIQGFNLNLLGLKSGVSDLLIFYPNKLFHGLWIEMKRNKKYTASERCTTTWLAQERFQEIVQDIGFSAHFCYGWEHGKKVVEDYLSET